jgi:hypothetical protein
MSSYAAFAVIIEDENGVQSSAPGGIDVHVRAEGAGSDAAESPLTTDAEGEIAAGTLAAISAGTLVHFRIENEDGLAGSVPQVTT